jgi:hypothetical protein
MKVYLLWMYHSFSKKLILDSLWREEMKALRRSVEVGESFAFIEEREVSEE